METLRTFIALEIDRTVQQWLMTVIDDLKKNGADVKWVSSDAIHLTLKFLGEISSEKVREVSERLPDIFKTFGPLKLSITHLGTFPPRGVARVVWAGIELNADQVVRIAEATDNVLEKIGFKKEQRPFHPHITLGRVRSPSRSRELMRAITGYTVSAQEFSVEKAVFFRSTLTPQGAVHEPITAVRLK